MNWSRSIIEIFHFINANMTDLDLGIVLDVKNFFLDHLSMTDLLHYVSLGGKGLMKKVSDIISL